MEDLKDILDDIRRSVPQVWGVAIVNEEGLPIDYKLARHLEMEDPVILGGLLASAVELMEKLVKELNSSSLDMVFAKGNRLVLIAGRVEGGSFTLLADPDVELGPMMLKFRMYRGKIEEFMKSLIQ